MNPLMHRVGNLAELSNRQARSHRRHGPAKFTDDEVRAIRKMGQTHTIREIARHWHISESGARNILQHLTYTHVLD